MLSPAQFARRCGPFRIATWTPSTVTLVVLLALAGARSALALQLRMAAGSVVVVDGDVELATYRFRDPAIPRPYFCTLLAPSGLQVTRNHPPRPNVDPVDHDTFHPGLWLAFGDLDGADSWRLKAPVVHERFSDPPRVASDTVTWTAINQYLRDDRQTPICRETNRIVLARRPHGVLLIWDSIFRGERGFYFGDQEELGLGTRVATPIAVKQGGRLVNSAGGVNEPQVWGKQADWCAYQGQIEDHHVGIVIMPHPENFRRCWFHARDYGFMAANPFGRQAFTGEEKSRVDVRPGEDFRLRYGVFWYDSGQEQLDLPAIYDDYLKVEADIQGP